MKASGNNYSDYIKLSAVLLPALSFANMIAPGLVKLLIKKGIARSEDFAGGLASLKLSLFKSQINIKGFDLELIKNKEKINFVHCDSATIGFSIKELLKGRVLAKIEATGLALTYIKDKTRLNERGNPQAGIPVLITSLNIKDINLEYIDHSTTPQVKLNCDSIGVSATNVTLMSTPQILPTQIECTGNIYGGQLRGLVKLNLAQPEPAFDVNFELKDISMARLNNFFSAYGKFKVEDGLLSFYTEAAAKNGTFKGYVKPIITNLEIKKDENHTGIVSLLWQEFLTATTAIFKNQKEDQLATKLPVEGTFSQPDINVWHAVAEVLKNAFITALKPSIDNEINIDSVKS